MSWKDNLLQASFRGIPFHVQSHEYSGGRRTSIFYLLYGDKDFEPVVEDSGPEADEFSIEAYVIQNDASDLDYFPRRDNLIAALKKLGPGLLIHPYLGEINVAVLGRFSMSETWEEGGIARFSITCARTVKATPKRTSESDSSIDDKVDDVNDITVDNFSDQYEPGGVFQQNTADTFTANLESLSEQIYQIQSIINTYTSEAVATIAAIIQTIDNIIDAPCDIAIAGLNAMNQMLNVVGLGVETITGGVVGGCSGVRRNAVILDGSYVTEKIGITTAKAIATVVEKDATEGIYVTEEQATNVLALKDMNDIFLIGVGCKILIRTDFTSQEKLIEYMNFFSDLMDYVLDRIGDEDTDIKTTDIYNALQDLRNLFVNEMLEKNTSIAKTNDYIVPAGNMSLLQLAYDLYEDLDRCCEVYDRNKPLVKHPGFPPGGETLKVLSE
jgi:prophage DNA circulation protein